MVVLLKIQNILIFIFIFWKNCQELICGKQIKFVRIDGSTSSTDRKTSLELFRTSNEVISIFFWVFFLKWTSNWHIIHFRVIQSMSPLNFLSFASSIIFSYIFSNDRHASYIFLYFSGQNCTNWYYCWSCWIRFFICSECCFCWTATFCFYDASGINPNKQKFLFCKISISPIKFLSFLFWWFFYWENSIIC